ncbi:MAG: 4-hydroxythreonine-4-phosphate dehydrogenase PdxA [Gemmatimonadota bacterium]|nr:4-hydroxythreonine-4-phosphate dehydrogenase PdxA [Gemmatimonadota bacterium]
MVRAPRIGITLGDPRGIGAEVTAAALPELTGFEPVLFGPRGLGDPERELEGLGRWVSTGRWSGDGGPRLAGELSARAVRLAVEEAGSGGLDGIVTAPISKAAIQAAGHAYPGHTELLRELTGAEEVTMMMAAERTPLGGPLRLALLTAHLPLRRVPDALTEGLVEARARIAIEALKGWWGIPRPRVAFAGLNPHAGEGGLFGDEELTVFQPVLERLGKEPDLDLLGVFPADTVFRKALEGSADLVITPYHDVGLAVLKTLARDEGVNVTAGLPFPRTSPDHGTALDIAGTGTADPGAMRAAIELCVRFCNAPVATP